jgi:hypothetical protein
MMMMIICAMYFIFEAYLEQNKPRFGHTTGIIVIFGIIVSCIIWKMSLSGSGSDADVILEDM